jgi:single-stranded-DNA-specific exonuclease
MNKWVVHKPDRNAVAELSTAGGIAPIAAAVLISNGCDNIEKARAFFGDGSISDPFLIKDMEKAVETINKMAFTDGKKVCIYGDYDCDGVCSSAILYTFLFSNGADVFCHINSRDEGFGLNAGVIEKLRDAGTELIITVDNGISAIHEAELIQRLGMTLVVTDHHTPGAILPVAAAVVCPHRQDETAPFREYCGCGVALMLIAAMMDGDTHAALEEFSDITALATIADMVPLTGDNRTIVTMGLHYLEHTENPGLKALISESGIKPPFTPSHMGFTIGPRINAAGRLGHAKSAFELLTFDVAGEFTGENTEEFAGVNVGADTDSAVTRLAKELCDINTKRKTIENDALSAAETIFDEHPEYYADSVLCLYIPNVNHGVVGLVAGRLLERFGKPVFVMTDEEDGELRGSARSLPGFSVYEALRFAGDALTKYGGHALAGGFSLHIEHLPNLRDALRRYAEKYTTALPVAVKNVCMELSPADLTLQNARALTSLSPFGQGFEEPLFLIRGAVLSDLLPLSDGKHTRLKFRYGNTPLSAVCFGKSPAVLGFYAGETVDFICTFGSSVWNENVNIDLKIADIRLSGLHQQRALNALALYEAWLSGKTTDERILEMVRPEREDFTLIYKQLMLEPIRPFRIDLLCERNFQRINPFKLKIILSVFSEAGLVTIDHWNGMVSSNLNPEKADLFATATMKKLI